MSLGYQEEDVGTRSTKRHDKKRTRKEIKSKLLFVPLKTRNTSNIFNEPNMDAAMWGPFSYNYSFYPYFSSADTKYAFLSSFPLINFSFSTHLCLHVVLSANKSFRVRCNLFPPTRTIYSNVSQAHSVALFKPLTGMRAETNDGGIPVKAGHLLRQHIL